MAEEEIKPKHTPGEWKVDAFEEGRVWVKAEEELICKVVATEKHETELANAYLLSASPDMYEILLELDKDLKEDNEDGNMSNIGKAFWDKVKKAITKAEGK